LKNNAPIEGVQLYQGISYLALQQNEKAIVALQSASEGNFSASTQWYLALAYLQQEDWSACRSMLRTIIKEEKHPYYAAARDLRADIPQ